ncbi:hypothetical protein FRC03_003726 [Tulasnella sp. 419]|nr:hypothetical protein FRC03_003726 [Tulasnella sp. 419]
MYHLRNSNKKKGFKATLQSRQPLNGNGKIVFLEQTPDTSTASQRRKSGNARLIPPSERTDLPPNVFVTSVDVEAGLWDGVEDKAPPSSKKVEATTRKAEKNVDQQADQSSGEFQKTGEYWKSAAARQQAETNFDKLPSVGASLLPNTIVAWKALAIDPIHLTPQLALHLGKVTSVKDGMVTVGVFDQPKELSFGKSKLDDMVDEKDGGDGVEEEMTLNLEETKTWKLVA